MIPCLSVERATGALYLLAVILFFLVLDVGAFTFSGAPRLRFFVHLVTIPPSLTLVCPIVLCVITVDATINSSLGGFSFFIVGQMCFGRQLLDRCIFKNQIIGVFGIDRRSREVSGSEHFVL